MLVSVADDDADGGGGLVRATGKPMARVRGALGVPGLKLVAVENRRWIVQQLDRCVAPAAWQVGNASNDVIEWYSQGSRSGLPPPVHVWR